LIQLPQGKLQSVMNIVIANLQVDTHPENASVNEIVTASGKENGNGNVSVNVTAIESVTLTARALRVSARPNLHPMLLQTTKGINQDH